MENTELKTGLKMRSRQGNMSKSKVFITLFSIHSLFKNR